MQVERQLFPTTSPSRTSALPLAARSTNLRDSTKREISHVAALSSTASAAAEFCGWFGAVGCSLVDGGRGGSAGLCAGCTGVVAVDRARGDDCVAGQRLDEQSGLRLPLPQCSG